MRQAIRTIMAKISSNFATEKTRAYQFNEKNQHMQNRVILGLKTMVTVSYTHLTLPTNREV